MSNRQELSVLEFRETVNSRDRSQRQRLQLKRFNLAGKRPILSHTDKAGPNRIVSYVVPLFAIALARTQQMVKKFALPKRCCSRCRWLRPKSFMNSSARPSLPSSNEIRERFRFEFRRAEEVNVVGHNRISSDMPTVSVARRTPFFDENLDDVRLRQNRLSIFRTHCYKIKRRVYPSQIQSP